MSRFEGASHVIWRCQYHLVWGGRHGLVRDREHVVYFDPLRSPGSTQIERQLTPAADLHASHDWRLFDLIGIAIGRARAQHLMGAMLGGDKCSGKLLQSTRSAKHVDRISRNMPVIELPIAIPAAESDPSADAAVQLLQLAVRLHTAGCDPLAWRAALKACSAWLGCTGVLDPPSEGHWDEPDALEAFAGRVTHCASYGTGACGGVWGDPLKRARCAALAPHLHEAAKASRDALQATLFDQLPPIWILDRGGRVRDSNAQAKAITAAGDTLVVADGLLAPVVPGGGARLRRLLTDLDHETRFSWPDQHDGETTLLLRLLPADSGIAATLLPEPAGAVELAALLVLRLKLTVRQGDLAAHLLVGQTLSDSARAMGISRNTANEHLGALLLKVGAPDRKTLLGVLRRAVTG